MNCKRILLSFLFVLALTAHTVAQQPSAAEEKSSGRRNGTITGRVITADGQPLSDVLILAVAVNAKFGEMAQSTCDEEGNFKLTGLRTAAYRILATMPGYVSATTQSDTELYRLGDYALLTMVRGGIITGRVTDAAGEPMAGVRVMPQLLRDATGRRVSPSGMTIDPTQLGRLTDDRGIYRLYGLQPGIYIVSVNGSEMPAIGSGMLPHDSPTFHPSAPRDTAAEIVLHASGEATGVDIRHRGERGHLISGTLSGETESDTLLNAVIVSLKSAATGELQAITAAMGGSRGFALTNVADGEYELVAVRANEKDDRTMSTPRRVSVKGADVSGIELKLLPLASISGRVLIEKTNSANACESKESFTLNEISLVTDLESSKPPEISLGSLMFGDISALNLPNEKGEFTVKNLEAGAYRLLTNLPGDYWFVRSMTLPPSGAAKTRPDAATRTDATRSPISVKSGERVSGLEITLGEGAAAVSGKIVSATEGKSLPAKVRVFLIPAEPTAAEDVLRYRELAGTDGKFHFKNLAPGKYRVLARSDSGEPTARPAAYEATERARLRREAEAAGQEFSLSLCQRRNDLEVKYTSNP